MGRFQVVPPRRGDDHREYDYLTQRLLAGARTWGRGFPRLTYVVGNAAQAMVEEVRRQFREIPGIMEGTGKPDAARCVEISTEGSLKQMVVPGLIAVAAPILWSTAGTSAAGLRGEPATRSLRARSGPRRRGRGRR